MSEVLNSGVTHQRYAPKHDVDREVFCDGYSLDDPVGWEFNDEDGNVNTSRQPGIL